MSVSLLTENIWSTLTAAARNARGPSLVAVAYFGQGAARLLPLNAGSQLVVDASEAAVKSGQTCPEELRKLVSKGVRVYSIRNLHAKVFVFGTMAFIGSANASQRSAGTLVEAVAAITDRSAVAAARSFVCDLCLHELGPEALARLGKMYRPPQVFGDESAARTSAKRNGSPNLPRLRLVHLLVKGPPAGSETTLEAGRDIAVRRLQNDDGYEVEDFWWRGTCPFQSGDIVVQILREEDGRRMVSPPGTVIYMRPWHSGSRTFTFVYLEVPNRRRISLDRLSRRLGPDTGKRLYRGGVVNQEFAKRLLEFWG